MATLLITPPIYTKMVMEADRNISFSGSASC